jgi:hypothetical protein
MYITVPNNTETTTIKNTNTNILVLLALSALARLLDAPTKRASLRILKTLNRRKALNAVRYWEPMNNSDRYFGSVDKRSTIPKKLKTYVLGFRMLMILKIYSKVKRIVTIHSDIFRKVWYSLSIPGTLSNMTMITL